MDNIWFRSLVFLGLFGIGRPLVASMFNHSPKSNTPVLTPLITPSFTPSPKVEASPFLDNPPSVEASPQNPIAQQPNELPNNQQSIEQLRQQQLIIENMNCTSTVNARASEALARVYEAQSDLMACETASCRDTRRMEQDQAQEDYRKATAITPENMCINQVHN